MTDDLVMTKEGAIIFVWTIHFASPASVLDFHNQNKLFRHFFFYLGTHSWSLMILLIRASTNTEKLQPMNSVYIKKLTTYSPGSLSVLTSDFTGLLL